MIKNNLWKILLFLAILPTLIVVVFFGAGGFLGLGIYLSSNKDDPRFITGIFIALVFECLWLLFAINFIL